MMATFILSLYFLMWYCLVGLSCLFAISGLDDLLIDIGYWVRQGVRWIKYRKAPLLTYEKLAVLKEQRIAIFVPCWQEAGVIGAMLQHNTHSIDYENYIICVGAYPNDIETVKEIQTIEHNNPHVRCFVGEVPGPTNKAANLNQIYRKLANESIDIIVFHDSEDIIHPLSLKLYNYLIPKKDMVQIPVFPLSVAWFHWVHWLYADEFSENHTKNIIVREAIKAHVPSAGVGTAFSKKALQVIAGTDEPFSVHSLTEDYRTSLNIRLQGLSQIFVTQSILRTVWVKRGWIKTRYVLKRQKERIATRAMFPTEYKKAVREKARWVMGIVFQEWEQTVWPKIWPVRYSLGHDRKAFMTHFINGSAYIVLFFWIVYSFFTRYYVTYPSLQEQFNQHPWVWSLVLLVSGLMLERILQRLIAVWRIYGFFPAILSIPRTFLGNVLNLHAVLRAYNIYFSQTMPKQKASSSPVWDKTEHVFPGCHLLSPYRKRLGDLCVEAELISAEDLKKALIIQHRTGDRLGEVLSKEFNIPWELIQRKIAVQFDLPFLSKNTMYAQQRIHEFSKKKRRRLESLGVFPLGCNPLLKTVHLGIQDPMNELLIGRILRDWKGYSIQFSLIEL